MIQSLVTRRLLVGTLLALGGAFAPAVGGSLNLSWQASAGATGYRIHYGPSSGTYTNSIDVGNVTQTTINGLTDCANLFFAATAYNAAGESGYSNVVSSWPRPVITNVTPTGAQQGAQLNLTLTGSNFQGGSTFSTSNAGVGVNSVAINSCTQLTASITISPTASTGAANLTVTNPAGATGTGTNLFTIQQVSGQPPPNVQNLRRTDVQ